MPGLEAARWIEAQRGDLLPVQYFHVVFTVPTELHDLFLAAPRVAYRLLFAAVAETLQQVARRRLGITIAITAVLHTWTQLLLFHPHLHCIVPGGGLDAEHTSWISTRPDFFLPVHVLSAVFRGKLLAMFEHAIAHAKIPAEREHEARDRLKQAAAKRWVVYCKPPFAGPDQVLAYLARYTHRIAISNDRLVSLHDGHVTFRWTDRAHGHVPRAATLEADVFLRRFLLCTCCPTASCASGTTAGSPTAPANDCCPGSASCWVARRSLSCSHCLLSRKPGKLCSCA
jgi:hypothetical protein